MSILVSIAQHTFSHGIPTKAEVQRNTFQCFINYTALVHEKMITYYLLNLETLKESKLELSFKSAYLIWQPNKKEESVATSTCTKERLQEGCPISLPVPFSKCTIVHSRNENKFLYLKELSNWFIQINQMVILCHEKKKDFQSDFPKN